MVRPGGFEPPTSWFVAMRSIQLIYGRNRKVGDTAKALTALQVVFIFRSLLSLNRKDLNFSFGSIFARMLRVKRGRF